MQDKITIDLTKEEISDVRTSQLVNEISIMGGYEVRTALVNYIIDNSRYDTIEHFLRSIAKEPEIKVKTLQEMIQDESYPALDVVKHIVENYVYRDDSWKQCAREGRKVDAIKTFRLEYSYFDPALGYKATIGLKRAKDIVEAFLAQD